MNITVEIDPDSGFCGGVIRAVDRAEEYLSGAEHSRLYSLGSIVHNEAELSRLRAAGLVTIGLSDLSSLHKGDSLLIRAHGEPPSTYSKAEELGLDVIDCTCPVVLNLQKTSMPIFHQETNKSISYTIIIKYFISSIIYNFSLFTNYVIKI